MPPLSQVRCGLAEVGLVASASSTECTRLSNLAAPRTAIGTGSAAAGNAPAYAGWPCNLPRFRGLSLDGVAAAAPLAPGPVSLFAGHEDFRAARLPVDRPQPLPAGALSWRRLQS